eukprot:gene18071-biopygen5323
MRSTAWARALMLEGAPLVHAVPGRAGWELRLVVQHKLPRRERHLQVGLQLRAHADDDLHLGVKKAQRVAPLRFDLVHGDVSLFQQVHRRLQAAAHQRGANAGRAVVRVAPQRVGHIQFAQNLLAHPARLGGGSTTVHVDGQPTRSCVTPISVAAGKKITTIEGVAADPVGRAVQAAWVQHDVAQCGYRQSGQIMGATGLLKKNKSPTDADIDAAMAGNVCRCGTYQRIRAAIHDAASALSKNASA